MRRAVNSLFIVVLGAWTPMLHAQVVPPGFPLGARIPAITGQVVDAVTGKPVRNIDVTLRAVEVGGEQFRHDSALTAPNGTFAFKTSVEPKLRELLASMEKYWLTVNYGAQREAGDDPSWDVATDPLFDAKRREPAAHEGRNAAYFPLAIQFVRRCKQMWNANCFLFSQTENIRVPLIPVFDDPQQCNTIADTTIKEQCRQLNTYRAAFLHIETIAEVRRDKELCRQVGHVLATKYCLEALQGYVERAISPSHPPPPAANASVNQTLILTPIAGLSVSRTLTSPMNPFLETIRHVAYYRLKDSQEDAAGAWVSTCSTEEGRAREMLLDRSIQPVIETIDGNKIKTTDSTPEYTVLWTSGSNVIRLSFFHAARGGPESSLRHFKEASLEVRREMIRQYLTRYPSSL